MWEDRGAKWGAQGFLFSEFGLDAREGRQVCRNQFFPDITGYHWTLVGESGRTIRYFFGSVSASPLLPTGGRFVRIPAGSNKPAGSRVAGKVGRPGGGATGDLLEGSRWGGESIDAAGSTPTAPMLWRFSRSWSAAPANDGFLDLDIRLHVAKELLPSALHVVPLGIAPRRLEEAL